ncbi:MAG: TldD/PmbA family protein [Gammaproteobacteria bacterium]|nr:MAG: TldD/PmbA family protein [Gammaproteobacteria bacterium]
MPILSKDEAKKILTKVIGFSTADGCSATLAGNKSGNIRYARNSVSTSGASSDTTLVVQCNYGKKVATATINEFDEGSLKKVVQRAQEMAKLSPENPEFMDTLPKQKYKSSNSWFDSTANASPEYRAQAAAHSIEDSKKQKLIAAGFLNDTADFTAIANNNGLFGYYTSTNVDFSVTIRTEDGKGSGWVTRDYNDMDKFDARAASKVAIQKSAASAGAKALEPGRYTVILEPAASVGLLNNMMANFDARTADEGRSFLSKKGGGNKLGEKLFDEAVNIYSDPWNEEIPTAPWTGENLPAEKVSWIEKGVIKNLNYSRFWASEKDVKPVAGTNNIIMLGGDKSLEQMIAKTKKGILVTRMWYIRPVDPQTLLYTGLTRDGTFYIENGKIKYPIKNFRFNESPVIMLNNIEELGKPQRINGNLIPPMKIRDFTFSSLSDAV